MPKSPVDIMSDVIVSEVQGGRHVEDYLGVIICIKGKVVSCESKCNKRMKVRVPSRVSVVLGNFRFSPQGSEQV